MSEFITKQIYGMNCIVYAIVIHLFTPVTISVVLMF